MNLRQLMWTLEALDNKLVAILKKIAGLNPDLVEDANVECIQSLMLFQRVEDSEDRHDCCMSMDFLQVLIHQHAQTIVALQELQSEVTTLKDFRNSVLSSLPELKQSIPGSSSSVTGGTDKHSHNNGLSSVGRGGAGAVGVGSNGGGGSGGSGSSGNVAATTGGATGTADIWTSPKLIDSGFSTETNKSSPTNKSDDEDPLYSLLDLIQLKVTSTASSAAAAAAAAAVSQQTGQGRGCNQCLSTCGVCEPGVKQYVPNAKRVPGPSSEDGGSFGSREERSFQLGRLDHVLPFRPTPEDVDDCSSQVTISRQVIGAVLRESNVVELQRQILFGINRVKTLEARLHNLESTTSESRLASKYLALSQENEQLRFKLKEQEIQLVGTKARLRILERIKDAKAVAAAATSGSSSNLMYGFASTSALNMTAGDESVGNVVRQDDVGEDRACITSRYSNDSFNARNNSNLVGPPEPTPRKSKTAATTTSTDAATSSLPGRRRRSFTQDEVGGEMCAPLRHLSSSSSYIIENYANDHSKEEFYVEADVVNVPVNEENESSSSVTDFKNSRNVKGINTGVTVICHNNNNNVDTTNSNKYGMKSNNNNSLSGKNNRRLSSKDKYIIDDKSRSGVTVESQRIVHANFRRSVSSSPPHQQHDNLSWDKSAQEVFVSGGLANGVGGRVPTGLDKGYLTNLSNGNSHSNNSSSSAGYLSGGPNIGRGQSNGATLQRPSRIPVTTSRPNTPGKKVVPPPGTPPKSLSSISSKSSIPVPVTRLKRSQSSNSRNSNKNKMGQLWAHWFG